MVAEQEFVGPPLVGVDSSWKIHSLESICDGVFDCPHSTPKLVDEGIFMVRTQDIRKGYFDTSNAVFVSQETYEERIKRAEPSPGDILFSREGTYFGDAAEIPLGTKVCLGQRMVLIRPKSELINPSFLRIWINSATFQNYLLAFRDGTVAERLNMSTVRTLPIPAPPLPEQNAIAHILGTLDDKIELNRRMNATLEEMAQALFKSWFIDFDPVLDNAIRAGNPIPDELAERAEIRRAILEQNQPSPSLSQGERNADASSSPTGRSGDEGPQAKALAAGNPIPDELAPRAEVRKNTLANGTANRDAAKVFPDSFIETKEMGWIPEGWETSTIDDECEIVGGGTPSTKNPDFWDGGEFPWVTPKDFSALQDKVLLTSSRFLTQAGLDKVSSGLLPKDTVLMSSRAPVGYLAISKIETAINQGFIGMICNKRLSPEFVLQWADSRMDDIKRAAGGSTFAEISKKAFRPFEIVVPNQEALGAYTDTAGAIYNRIADGVLASTTLTQLRDTLLPKLISGELRISEAQQLTEKALV